MLYYLRFIFLFLSLAGANSIVFGQCTQGAPFPTTTFTPQCNQSKVITSTGKTNQYSRVYVIAGYQYNFRSLSSGSAATNDYITIATNVTNPVTLFSGRNGNNGIFWTATFTGVIRFYTHTTTAAGLAACPSSLLSRSRQVIMAPFQAKISVINSLCAGNPGTGQYTITVGPNHGWNSTSVVSPLNAYNTLTLGNIFPGGALPLSYNITSGGTSVNSGTGGTLNTNAEICPNCPAVVNSNSLVNGTSTWSGTSTLTLPFTGYTYLTTTSPYPAGTNTFSAPNLGSQGMFSHL